MNAMEKVNKALRDRFTDGQTIDRFRGYVMEEINVMSGPAGYVLEKTVNGSDPSGSSWVCEWITG